MTGIRVHRRIGARPASIALLLAAGNTIELWPGVRGWRALDGRVVVEHAAGRAVRVTAERQQRTPAGIVARFAVAGSGATSGGSVTVAPTWGSGATLVLELVADGPPQLGLRRAAEAFVANLAAAAEARALAA